ncbi:MAG: 50S ribosomal protein L18 [Syntrophomonadaceae bacterium]|nr:50S ribosomal protein L18 [Syntrophomonadaceae bacterium]
MIKKTSRKELRAGRQQRIRKKLSGSPDKPRLCIFKSLNHTYAQIIDDVNGVTLAAASTLDKDMAELGNKSNTEAAKAVGASIAKKAAAKGISEVVFDRSGYKYHGTVVALADAARENGLVF